MEHIKKRLLSSFLSAAMATTLSQNQRNYKQIFSSFYNRTFLFYFVLIQCCGLLIFKTSQINCQGFGKREERRERAQSTDTRIFATVACPCGDRNVILDKNAVSH